MKHAQIALLIKLKNSSLIKSHQVTTFYNAKKLNLVKFLYQQGVLQSYSIKGRFLLMHPRYLENYSLLTKLQIVSKPSLSKMLVLKDISKLQNSRSVVGVSTDLGIKTLTECKLEKLGGKILFVI